MYASAAPKFAAAGYPLNEMPKPKGPYVTDLYEVAIPYLTGLSYDDYNEALLHDLEVGIPDIAVPTFFIGSDRDAFTGFEPRLQRGIGKNVNIIRVMNHSRSHIGYFSGLLRPKRWVRKPIWEFIQVCID
jgi:hypothetical protein